jgi:hypothetical protein
MAGHGELAREGGDGEEGDGGEAGALGRQCVIGSRKCGICDLKGHYSTTCPLNPD